MGVKIPEGFRTLNPAMIIKGTTAAIKYYENVFGAKVSRIFYGPDDKTVMHAELVIGDSTLMLGEEFPDMGALSPKSPGGGTSMSLYMFVEDVDKVFNKAIEEGGTIKTPVSDGFWGDRFGVIIDPFGHIWMLATHVKDLSDEEIKEAAREAFEKAEM